MANTITTFTDLPAKSDLFGLNPYIDGLANFINGCATPITIAIQGDWGSGKTSMMEMTKEKLGKVVYPVWFNTWQYSQFNLDTELTISFMREIVDSIGAKMEVKKGFDKALNSIGIVAKNVATFAADRFMGEQAGKVLGEVLDSFSDGAMKVTSAAAAVKILRNEFEKCISFDQDISSWNLSARKLDKSEAFLHCPISEKHKPKDRD
jgi:predicted KAP-like P-loop ATPase